MNEPSICTQLLHFEKDSTKRQRQSRLVSKISFFGHSKMGGLKGLTFLWLMSCWCIQMSHQQNSRGLFTYQQGGQGAMSRLCNEVTNIQITSFQATGAPNTETCQCTLSTQPGDVVNEVIVQQLDDQGRWMTQRRVPITTNPQTVAVNVAPSVITVDNGDYDLPINVLISKYTDAATCTSLPLNDAVPVRSHSRYVQTSTT